MGFGHFYRESCYTLIADLCCPSCKACGCWLVAVYCTKVSIECLWWKNFKTDSKGKSLGRLTLRKQLSSGSRKKSQSKIICKTNQSIVKRHFTKHLPKFMPNIIRYESFVTVSGSLGDEVSEDDDFLSSHEHETSHITPLDKTCIEFEFQVGRS